MIIDESFMVSEGVFDCAAELAAGHWKITDYRVIDICEVEDVKDEGEGLVFGEDEIMREREGVVEIAGEAVFGVILVHGIAGT